MLSPQFGFKTLIGFSSYARDAGQIRGFLSYSVVVWVYCQLECHNVQKRLHSSRDKANFSHPGARMLKLLKIPVMML